MKRRLNSEKNMDNMEVSQVEKRKDIKTMEDR
jgi:hypothetical protein